MGIQDRDYYREGSSFLDAWNRQGITVWLIAITCGVFFGQCITGAPILSPFVQIGGYAPQLVQEGEVWRLFTPMFQSGMTPALRNGACTEPGTDIGIGATSGSRCKPSSIDAPAAQCSGR